ncbi:MAG TPA: recombinase family protein [Nitrospira sp.]|nr:recombinase family protein [Nitrospira sp.]
MKRAAAYARVASVPGGTGMHPELVADQMAAVAAYCEKLGWQIVADYTDFGFSANNDNRPAFSRMIEDALGGDPGFEVIIAADHARYFRNNVLGEMYRRKLRKAGIEMISASEELDGDQAQLLLHRIHEMFKKYEAMERGKRIRRGIQEARRKKS